MRVYDGRPLTPEDAERVRSVLAAAAAGQPGLHFALCCGSGTPFQGFKRSYGFFRGVANYVAVCIDPSTPDAFERAGYFSQKAVTEFTALGLATCYVGGTFDTNAVDVPISKGQQLLFLITIGYGAGKSQTGISSLMMKLMHRHDRSPEQFYVDDYGGMPLAQASAKFPTLISGLEALASAPSQLNKQPVRIHVGTDGALRAFIPDPSQKDLIDLGIGKFNFAAATGARFRWGNDAPFDTEN